MTTETITTRSTAPTGAMSTSTKRASGRGMLIAEWLVSLAAAAILAPAAAAKFFNFTATGSKPLADALGVGHLEVIGIGVLEALALLLLLAPRTRAVGALLTVLVMSGALFSHLTVIGFSGSPAAEMWPLALVVLVAGAFVLVRTRRDLPIVGRKIG